MDQKSKFSGWLPHLYVLGIIILIAVLFCIPAFKGNYLDQHDIFTWLQGSKEHRDFYEKTGEQAGWAGNMFSGMPQILIDPYSTGNWYSKVQQTLLFYKHGLPHHPAVLFILGMVSFYLLSSALRWNKWLGLTGAVAFAFASYNPIIIVAGHTTKYIDVAYIPALFAAIVWAYRGKYWLGGALAGVVMAFIVETGHYQIIYYTAITVLIGIAGIAVSMIRKGQTKIWLKGTVFLAVGAILGILVNNARFIQTQNNSKYTIRGGHSELQEDVAKHGSGLDKDYAFVWSNGVGETMCILVPGLYGGGSAESLPENSAYERKLVSLGVPQAQAEQMNKQAPTYWGPQPMLSGPVYFGAIICFLFVLSLFVVRSPLKWWGLGLSIFFIILSTGKNLAINDTLFDIIPGLNKFRTPSMALVIPSFIFVVMAVAALREVLKPEADKADLLKKLKLSVYITGGITLAILLYSQAGMTYRSEGDQNIASQFGEAGEEIMKAIREDRAGMALKDSFRSLVLILLAGGVLWALLKSKLSQGVAIGLVAVLIGIDNIGVAHRYMNESHYIDETDWERKLNPRAVDKQIMQDKELNYRVFDITKSTFNDAFPSLFHHSVGGYHGAKLQIYQDLIENQIGRFNSSVLNMLNTKYFILPTGQQQPKEAVQLNPNALGNGWFVNTIKVVKTAREEMDALNGPSLQNPSDSTQGNFNPAAVAVIREDRMGKVNSRIGRSGDAYVKLTAYAPNRLSYEVENAQDGFAVFSEIYYPEGWTATIDGRPAEIIRTDYVLRGLNIPAGKHKVEFSFKYPGIDAQETLAVIASILLTIMAGLAVFFSTRPKRPVEVKQA